MGLLLTAAAIWRRYMTDGVPSSGPNQPSKTDIVTWGTFIEAMIGAGVPGLAFATLSALNADLAHADKSTAIVYNDSAANNGFYVKAGASGAGSWSRIGDLPNSIVRVTVTGGSGNAIVATAPETPLMPGSKIYIMTPTANNSGAVTLALNGVSPVTITDALGSNLVTGALLNGSQVIMAWAVDHYQLLLSVPVDATGILTNTLAARDAAAASSTSAASSATAAQGYALASNPINRPAFGPVASPWPNAIGDSLFTNAHATALPSLIATAMSWSSTNTQAVSGSTIADQASIYGFQMTPSIVNPALVWLGTNDCILDGADNRTTEQTSLEGLRALLCHLAIPTAKRVTGQAMTVEGGTWINMGSQLDPGGVSSATQNSVKRAIVTGRHVVVAGWANLSSNGQMSVLIGNNSESRYTLSDTITFKRSAILTNSPGGTPVTTVPFVRIYKNVGIDDTSKMEVSVFVTSATGAGNDAFVSYVAGLSGRQDEAMPLVVSFKLHNFTAAAEAAQGTNANRRERFNRGISNIVDELMGLGLWVVPLDTASTLWDTSLLDTDGLHPKLAGNTALTTEAVTVLTAAQSYYHTRNSQLSNGGYSDTVGSDLYPRGRLVIEDFRRVVKARAAVGSGFSAHCNGSNTSVANNSNAIVPCTTEIYDVSGDYNAAAATWSPPAGQVSIRGAATFTVGVDQAPYELQLFKNGSLFKVIARTLASGTAPVAVMGDAYDMAADGDFYAIFVLQASDGTATLDGTATKTYFMGASAY
jgi:hypothetical protein